jgi:hypothetical protein
MENAPVITLWGWQFHHPEDHERFGQWASEVFYPILTQSPFLKGINRYRIVKESAGYCNFISIFLFENYKAYVGNQRHRPMVDIAIDNQKTWGKKRAVIWNHVCQLERSAKNAACAGELKKDDLKGDKIPAMHLEAWELPREKEGDYYEWFTEIGFPVFITRMLGRPGMTGYEHYRLVPGGQDYMGMDFITPEEPINHSFFSIFHFDSVLSCQEFSRSRELAAYRAALSPYFPEGLKIKWDVDYQLIGSWKNEKLVNNSER